jgi:diadenylate cyclase
MRKIFLDLLNGFNASNLSIPKFRLIDLADILIVAYCIYKIIMWVKGTRASSLFKGIIMFFIIVAFAYYFKLYTIMLFLDKTLDVGIIVLAFLFQPELRKALEQMGTGKFKFSLFKPNVFESPTAINVQSINEIISAVQKMSQIKQGSIIAIERLVPLGDHEATGVPISAIITSQLLINIFENKTPLHDGAVIIKNNKISAASCILPLTKSHIVQDLGTRHRAAIGASEVSDADVIVVSEETGHISIAREGKLFSNLTEKKIREMLTILDISKKKLLWRRNLNNEDEQ